MIFLLSQYDYHIQNFLMCKSYTTQRERIHITKFLKNQSCESRQVDARCNDWFRSRAWTCTKWKEIASPAISITEFQKTASSRTKPQSACRDSCWHLWTSCLKCKGICQKSPGHAQVQSLAVPSISLWRTESAWKLLENLEEPSECDCNSFAE